jgi:hypothetical protein
VLQDKGGEIYNVKAYGAVGDGTTDDYTAVMAAISAAQNANGGTIYFPPGRYRINSQLLIPNDSASPAPHQKPIQFVGAGSHWAGIASPLNGESILDLRYGGTVGKIVTLGLGKLGVENLTLTNGGTDSLPFIYTTNTTLHIAQSAFIGASGASPFQDAIVLGGRGAVVNGSSTGYFQGYGTIIEGNYFDYVNRGVLLQVNANAVVIRDNTWWTNCAGTAAIEDWNDTSYQNAGLFTSGNLIEMNNYTYGISLYRTIGATLLGDSFYDGGTFTSYYHFNSANALPNMVVPGYYTTSAKLSSGAGSPAFPVTSAAGVLSFLDSAGAFTNSVIKTGRLEVVGNRIVIRNGTTNDDVFNIYNSSGHTAKLLASQSDGSLVIADNAANNVLTFANPDGTFTFKNNKATTGYTYWETQAGAGQAAIPLGRWKDLNGTTNTTVTADGSFRFDARAVSALPTCNAAATGTHATVNDALAPAIGSNVSAGGAAKAAVWCNGANWTVTGI